MSLRYVHEKTYGFVHTMALLDRPLAERFVPAVLPLLGLDRECPDEAIAARLVELQDRVTAVGAQADEGTVANTVSAMSESVLTDTIRDYLELHDDVTAAHRADPMA